MENLIELADLLRKRNAIDEQIAKLIERPASTGHIGEYIAAQIFDIALEISATNEECHHDDEHCPSHH